MGKEAALKSFRKQLRTVVREHLSEVVNAELVSAVRKELGAKVDVGLEALNKVMNDKMNKIDERSKDIQNSLVRNVLAPSIKNPVEGLVPPPNASEPIPPTGESQS